MRNFLIKFLLRMNFPLRLKHVVRQAKSNGLLLWPGDTKYAYFWGECPWLKEDHLNVLRYILGRIHDDFPDRNDRALRIYDLCSQDQYGCSHRHPGTSHGGYFGDRVDLPYYTFDINHTQLEGSVEIWTDKGDPKSELLPVFDIERNVALFSMIRRFFPESKISVDERIEDALGLLWLDGDDPMSWSHHLHCHIVLGYVIDWEAPLK